MISAETLAPVAADASAGGAWLRALELTTPIARNRERVLSTVIEERASQAGDSPALLSDGGSMTYRELDRRVNQYARWALEAGIAKGQVVCLLMNNQPEYLAIWLGITSVGGVVSLLNTNLPGLSLARCIEIVSAQHVIVSTELAARLAGAIAAMAGDRKIWVHGGEHDSHSRLESSVDRLPGGPLDPKERRPPSVQDHALYIYTSGTTGMPKAVNVSHARIMQWSHWFAGMMGARPADRMYNCLPMYHSVGGVLAPGAILAAGGALVMRERFSASHFWSDVVRWDCTMFQYIGELCRYLLHTASTTNETEHRIRLACGNGLAPEVWDKFKERFAIPRILEFYAATEGGVSLFNVQGKVGAIGHIPAYLSHRFAPALVTFDVEKGEPARNAEGFCVRCATNQPGEAIGRVSNDRENFGNRFEGYTSEEASESRILRDVFEPGDRWVRTGDLMRKDDQGYFYFVDRIGDTFRWKGENVATSEVAAAICAFPGVKHANVYGVAIPKSEGRAGMAAIVSVGPLDLAGLRQHLASYLPIYARPLFVRIKSDVEVTGTLKYSKAELVHQGYDPGVSDEAVYFDNAESGSFTRLDQEIYERIQAGEVRL
jgi:fatty-acyl-CoA synthase